MPKILSEKSDNLGVQAIREAMKKAWLDNSMKVLRQAIESAQALNSDGLLDEEISLCEKHLQQEHEAAINRFTQKVSAESSSIKLSSFLFERVLENLPESKQINILGRIHGDPSDKKAILIMRKTEFQDWCLKTLGMSKAQ